VVAFLKVQSCQRSVLFRMLLISSHVLLTLHTSVYCTLVLVVAAQAGLRGPGRLQDCITCMKNNEQQRWVKRGWSREWSRGGCCNNPSMRSGCHLRPFPTHAGSFLTTVSALFLHRTYMLADTLSNFIQHPTQKMDYGILNQVIGREVDQVLRMHVGMKSFCQRAYLFASPSFGQTHAPRIPTRTPHTRTLAHACARTRTHSRTRTHAHACMHTYTQAWWGTRTEHIVGVAACLALTDHASSAFFSR